MLDHDELSSPSHYAEQTRILTNDDVTLKGTWFLPQDLRPTPNAVIVVLGGAGISARHYHRMAAYLANCNAAVLTFDYRGIGESRGKDGIREMQSGIESWAQYDIDAALSQAFTRFPNFPISAIAHSIGSLLLGGARNSSRISRLVMFGPHTGYWGDYRARWRPFLYLTWHALMPSVTRIIGYFPGRFLGLGEDLPPRIALDWADRRQSSLVRSIDQEIRFGPLLSRFSDVRAKALAISVTDDAFAPPHAAHRVLSLFPNLIVTHRVTSPTSLGCGRIGHFGLLRRPSRERFWRETAKWLLPSSLGSLDFECCPTCEPASHQKNKSPDSQERLICDYS